MRLTIPCVVALFSLACAPPPEEPPPIDFADTPLAGTINGEPWTFVTGATDSFLSDEDGFFTSFYGTPQDDVCETFGDGTPQLLTSLPTEPGEFRMSFRRNLTFSYDAGGQSQNDVATRGGGFRIDDIDLEGKTISGAIKAGVDEHEVDGTFTVTICD